MLRGHAAFTPSEARNFYDRFGKKQDAQGFYEDPPVNNMIAHARFKDARRIFEFGCGTGRLAARLLNEHLWPSASYLGCDISMTMIGIARERLKMYSERSKVFQTGFGVSFPLRDRSVDRVISCYVLDLLPERYVRAVFAEAHRVLIPKGKLCIVSLTGGTTLPSSIVSLLWMTIFCIRRSLVGGCRPIHLGRFIDRKCWELEHQQILAPFGVPSEVVVLRATRSPKPSSHPREATASKVRCLREDRKAPDAPPATC